MGKRSVLEPYRPWDNYFIIYSNRKLSNYKQDNGQEKNLQYKGGLVIGNYIRIHVISSVAHGSGPKIFRPATSSAIAGNPTIRRHENHIKFCTRRKSFQTHGCDFVTSTITAVAQSYCVKITFTLNCSSSSPSFKVLENLPINEQSSSQ